MDSLQLKLCDIQGRLFELSAQQGYDSEKFVPFFMRSEVAKCLDSRYNRMQWAGEEYLLEELISESDGTLLQTEHTYSPEVMYWIGYVYRYWHYYKKESSSKIYRQANVKTMKRNYMMFHTMDPELAIDDLIEIKRQKARTGNSSVS
ncbi:hypothetical protein [Fusicatenibacter saccharivorans]|uniref:hypothetical protein n=1 Tax=Fusicatenibacter saccharivorans TaxID=1150298 RepID=UPI003F8E3D61